MALYISNGVGVHSIEDDFTIPAGWDKITEAEAKKLNPDLFGAIPTVNPVAKPAAKATTTK